MSGMRGALAWLSASFIRHTGGIQYLIDTAAGQVERLTVIVCARAGQTIPGELRAAWLRELYPTVTVLLIDDCYPADDSRLWAAKTIEWLGGVPEWCSPPKTTVTPMRAFMGSRHVLG